MKHSRTALALAAGVAAGVAVAGVAAVAQSGGTYVAERAVAGTGDSAELQALAQLQGAAAADPAASASGAEGRHGPGGPGRGHFGAGLLGGRVLHGTLVVQGPDGKPVNVSVQRGAVTSVSAGTFVVRSSDGFTQTWSTDSTTHYMRPGMGRGPWKAKPGSSPSASSAAPGSGLAKGVDVLVLGRSTGASAGAARLVLSVPDGAGAGPGRWGPGWMGPGMHGHVAGHA